MDHEANLPLQAVATIVIGIGAVLACGHRCGFPQLVAMGVGPGIGLVLIAAYYLRASRCETPRDGDRRTGDGRVGGLFVAGFGLPLAAATVAWLTPSFHGLVFSSAAAAFAGVAIVLIPTSIFTSSLVDWYFILPFVNGVFGPPIWERDMARLSTDRRRRYAKYWVAHRGLCEVVVYLSFALALSIVFVAVGNAVSHDKTLPGAIESLGGAGIAFAVLTYLGPRARDALDYTQVPSAGLGTWAKLGDEEKPGVEGFVVDVSVHPGVQLRRADGEWRFVPLKFAALLHEHEELRPAKATSEWGRAAVLDRSGDEADKARREAPRS